MTWGIRIIMLCIFHKTIPFLLIFVPRNHHRLLQFPSSSFAGLLNNQYSLSRQQKPSLFLSSPFSKQERRITLALENKQIAVEGQATAPSFSGT